MQLECTKNTDISLADIPCIDDCRYSQITSIDVQGDACLPSGLGPLCFAFPQLRSLSLSGISPLKTWSGYTIPSRSAQLGFDCLSNILSTLPRLRNLHLDLHYRIDVNSLLGAGNCLNLAQLQELQALRVPLHFLLGKGPGPGGWPVVSFADPNTLLPASLKQLTLVIDITGWCHRVGGLCWKQYINHKRLDLDLDVIVNFIEKICCNSDFPYLGEVVVVWASNGRWPEGFRRTTCFLMAQQDRRNANMAFRDVQGRPRKRQSH